MKKLVGGWKKRAKLKKVRRLINAEIDRILKEPNLLARIEVCQVIDNYVLYLKELYKIPDENIQIDYDKCEIVFKPKQSIDFIPIKIEVDKIKVINDSEM